MFYYIPSAVSAALSIQVITYQVPVGWLIRNIHYWAGQFLLVVSIIHLIRVVFTGAYSATRRFNYLLGLGLFALLVLMDFSGYVLRWDTGVKWALAASTNLIKSIPLIGDGLTNFITGGAEPGTSVLVHFFAWHIYGLMTLALILMVWHVFRVRRDGGIASPPRELNSEQERINRFELVRREVLAMIFSMAVLILVSIFFPAPIAPAMTEYSSLSASDRAPWFLLWVQQMLKWGNPFFWGVFSPLILLTLTAIIPYTLPEPDASEIGRWFPKSNRLAQIALGIIIFWFVLLTIIFLLSS